MFCKNCGRQLPDNAAMCPACGTKPSCGAASGSERSGRDIKNLPDYAKEKDLDRSGDAIDTTRQKFSLSDPGQKKFSLSDPGQKKFSLSDPGQKKFSLSGKDRDSGGDIVRVNVNSGADAPRKEPAGFVNPLKNTGKTVFLDEQPDAKPSAAPERTAPDAPVVNEPEIRRPSPKTVRPAPDADAPVVNEPEKTDGQPVGETGFVNPLKKTGQDIRWGSDGDRNEPVNPGGDGDPSEIESHMGFAIFTLLCCCQPSSILAIIFAAMVSQEVKKGNFEQAQKYSNLAKFFCWVSIILSLFCGGISAFTDLAEQIVSLKGAAAP